MVTEVAAHEDECVRVGRCTGETADMADCVARCIEDVEGAIAEEVVGAEVADFNGVGFGERYLAEFSIAIGFVQGEAVTNEAFPTHLKSLSRTGESCLVG